jgi:DNA-binding NarL/FixJ family response regulator
MQERPVIRVLVADDHPVVRHGLEQILGEIPDIAITGGAGNAHEVLAQVRADACDVLLLDLAMPGAHGVELLETVKRERPELPVLVLSMYPEDQYALRVLQAGAAGYMTKESAADELVRAVRKIHAGGRYVTTGVGELLASRLGTGADRPQHERLSNREHQVLCLLGRALSVKQIARELHLSEKTVSTYRCRLLEKMQVRSTAELIRYAVQHRLVD